MSNEKTAEQLKDGAKRGEIRMALIWLVVGMALLLVYVITRPAGTPTRSKTVTPATPRYSTTPNHELSPSEEWELELEMDAFYAEGMEDRQGSGPYRY